MVGLIAGVILAVGYADSDVTADKKYPEAYAAFKKGFVLSFKDSFVKKAGRAPSDTLVEDCCRTTFDVITGYLSENKDMTDEQMQRKIILALFLPPKVEERIQKECESVVKKHLQAGTVYK